LKRRGQRTHGPTSGRADTRVARRDGRATTPRTACGRRWIGRRASKAGVARWAPNQLRHRRAEELRELEGIEAARVTLGHGAPSTTENYAPENERLAKRVAAEYG
jgi:hypothetical protein